MNRALLVIDVQESFRQQPLWPVTSNPGIVDQVARLVMMARRAGDAVFWVLHTEPGSGTVFDLDSGFVQLMAGIEPRAGEPVLTKTSHNAFTTTNLQQTLTAQAITELIICGIRTEQCCETTARFASDLGYQVTFVSDATATQPIPHWSAPADRTVEAVLADPLTLGCEEIVSRTEYALAGRFATIVSVDEVTGERAQVT